MAKPSDTYMLKEVADTKFDEMYRRLDTMERNFGIKLDLIFEQTSKHNGRMTRAEKTTLVLSGIVGLLVLATIPQLSQLLGIL